MDEPLTDAQRFPLLTEKGRQLLKWMTEHPHAPRWNFRVGDRLTRAGLERVRAFEQELGAARPGWDWGELPPWVPPFAARCVREVPFYRQQADPSDRFLDLPTCSRADLSRQPWSFVPDTQPLADLMVYTSSGATGHPLRVPSHPETAGMYLPLLRRALATRGVTLEGGSGRVAIVLLGAQRQTWLFASVASYLDEAGYIKLNLNPADWRDPEDRVPFLDACNPEIYTGDPLSFEELARLPLTTRPRALVSTAMMLLPGLKGLLEAHFGCPMIDLYSLSEAGPVAVATLRGHEILPHDLYVEVLDPEGRPCPPGQRGEVTLTGGRNPFLPLLRYRTGDWAALDFSGTGPVLLGLEGRPPTVFYTLAGQMLNNIDVTWALLDLPLPQFRLHQAEDGSLVFQVRGSGVPHGAIRTALLGLFGAEQQLTIEEVTDPAAWGEKVVQYTSAYRKG